MKNIIKKIVVFLYSRMKPLENSVLILESSFPSGSNSNKLVRSKALFESEGFSVTVMPYDDVRVTQGGFIKYLEHVKIMKEVSKFQFIVVTHSFQKYNKNQILINLWHGIPLKSMKYMETDITEVNRPLSNSDILITSSKMESVLMNASLHIPFIKHEILGSPRNDYFREANNDLGSLSFVENYKHVIIYIPTFRLGYFDRVEGIDYGTLFNLPRVDMSRLEKFLKENNILLITKYHPREVELREGIHNLESNIMNLSNEMLLENDLDLYELLPHTDLLITDYSSIYFDYLLLDKPIIFTPTDLDAYADKRGFLLEPYDTWTPGGKALDQSTLQSEIISALNDQNYYQEQRLSMRNIFHKYNDGKSTERLIKLMKEIGEA